jgi:hypothetical protein
MSRKLTIAALTSLLVILLCAPQAGANSVLFSNLGPQGQYDGSNGWLVDGATFNNQVMGMSFTPNATGNISDAVLALGYLAGNDSPINVYLETDNSGVPGNILDTLTQSGVIAPYPGGLVNFDCTSCSMVSEGTLYWLVALASDPNSQHAWMFSYQDQQGRYASNEVGSASGPWIAGTYISGGFQVDGMSNAVPEPGTLLILGSGILALAARLRTRLGYNFR